jgi:hypothetical protein
VPDREAEPPAGWDREPLRDDSADGEVEKNRREHEAHREIAHIGDDRSAARLRLRLDRSNIAAAPNVASQ